MLNLFHKIIVPVLFKVHKLFNPGIIKYVGSSITVYNYSKLPWYARFGREVMSFDSTKSKGIVRVGRASGRLPGLPKDRSK